MLHQTSRLETFANASTTFRFYLLKIYWPAAFSNVLVSRKYSKYIENTPKDGIHSAEEPW